MTKYFNKKAKTKVESILDSGDCEKALLRARQIDNEIKQVYPFYEMNWDQLVVIVLNPSFFNAQKMGYVSPENILEDINRHLVLSNQYITSSAATTYQPTTQTGIKTSPLGDPTRIKQLPTKDGGVPRKKDLKEKVYARDNFKCIVTGLAHAEAAHLMPSSAVASRNALGITADCWKITDTLLSPEFHNRYIDHFLQAIGFETPANLISLAPHIHDYMDRGFWAFQPDSCKGKCNVVKFYWLPATFKQHHGTKVSLENENDNTVRLIFDTMRKLSGSGFDARKPSRGTGYIGGRLEKGGELKTGQKFTIEHQTDQEAAYCHDMVGLH